MHHDRDPNRDWPSDEPDTDEPDQGFARDAAPPPQEIAELVETLVGYVRRALGFELDQTAETLPVLDHYVGQVHESLDDRPDLLSVVAPAVGAYFGEVVRTTLPSFWYPMGPTQADYYLCLRPAFLAFSPLGIAHDALTRGAHHAGPSPELLLLPSERVVVERRLGDLPPVPPGEYYLLSTRLEAIEIAAEALRAQQLLRQLDPVFYDVRDYQRRISLDGRVDG
jgi:hypothetical protein